MTEMLQRMGLHPTPCSSRCCAAMQTLTGTWRRAATRLAQRRQSGKHADEHAGNNQLDDLRLLLPEQNRLVLRGGCSSTGSGWRLDVEIPPQAG
ncbi:MAG: hypothetical protein ACLVJH_06950 [Faecalibacterium prausnitzii]